MLFSKTSIGRVLVLSLVIKKNETTAGVAEESGRQTTMGQPNHDSVDSKSTESFQTSVGLLSNDVGYRPVIG